MDWSQQRFGQPVRCRITIRHEFNGRAAKPEAKALDGQVLELTALWPRESMAVIGSSLGGFYAAVMAESLGCRAAFINPAVAPARDLARHIGEQTAFHDPSERFYFREEFIQQFALLDPYPLQHPERHWALIAKGDEVLDWREMHARYADCPMRLLEGSDHALSGFDQDLPHLTRFLSL